MLEPNASRELPSGKIVSTVLPLEQSVLWPPTGMPDGLETTEESKK
jgi:hypothetical protein